MSVPAEELDWAEAERDERRKEWWAWPFLVAFFLGMALVRRGFGLWSGAAGWPMRVSERPLGPTRGKKHGRG